MYPKVSIVIPCYNQAQYLRDAVSSVLNQDYPNKEIIVVNDGSPDNTREAAQTFGDAIIYIEQENKGLSGARNTGIRAANGKYIALLDCDDICLPGRIATEVSYLEAHPDICLVATDAILLKNGILSGLKSAVSGRPGNLSDFRWETVAYCPTPSTFMFHKDSASPAILFDESLQRAGEDWLFAVQMSVQGKLGYLATPTIVYRIHAQNATNFTELINAQNRIAAAKAVSWIYFSKYPSHFQAKLLYYRFATAWHVEPKIQALSYFWRALITDPTQLPYGIRVIQKGVINKISKLGH